jgi:hypothetical protein
VQPCINGEDAGCRSAPIRPCQQCRVEGGVGLHPFVPAVARLPSLIPTLIRPHTFYAHNYLFPFYSATTYNCPSLLTSTIHLRSTCDQAIYLRSSDLPAIKRYTCDDPTHYMHITIHFPSILWLPTTALASRHRQYTCDQPAIKQSTCDRAISLQSTDSFNSNQYNSSNRSHSPSKSSPSSHNHVE